MIALDSFGRTAQGLSRNPLGIIALFIVLVYGMAALVLSTTGTSFQPVERAPMIWFLVLFPVLVLLIFAGLVMKFPKNLYSPSDYGNAGDFVRALSPDEQRARIQEEVKEELQQEPVASRTPQSSPDTAPDAEGIRASVRQDVRSEYLLAESLVLRDLQAKFGGTVRAHAALVNNNTHIEFDAISRTQKTFTGVEIKLFRSIIPHPRVLERIADHARASLGAVTDLYPSLEFRYLLAIVADVPIEREPELQKRVVSYLARTNAPIDVEFYRLEELKAKYGATPDGETNV